MSLPPRRREAHPTLTFVRKKEHLSLSEKSFDENLVSQEEYVIHEIFMMKISRRGNAKKKHRKGVMNCKKITPRILRIYCIITPFSLF